MLVLERSAARSSSVDCADDSRSRDRTVDEESWAESTEHKRLRASATGLLMPLTCCMSVVNSEMNARCRISRGVYPVPDDVKAYVSGLWSL